MECNCETYECIEVFLVPCAETINLGLVADGSGVWKMVHEFNGTWVRTDIAVTNGSPIIVPNNFNEDYNTILKFYKPDNTIFNDTCYKLKIMLTVFTNCSDTPTITGQMYRQMVAMGGPAPINDVFGSEITVDNGNAIQFDDLIGAQLFSVEQVTNELAPQTGEGVDDFDSETGTITLSSSYTNTYFKIQYKK